MKSDLMEAAEMLRDFAGDIERQKIPRWTHAEIVQLAERLESLPAPDDMDFIDTAPEFTRDGMYRALVSEKLPAPGEAVAWVNTAQQLPPVGETVMCESALTGRKIPTTRCAEDDEAANASLIERFPRWHRIADPSEFSQPRNTAPFTYYLIDEDGDIEFSGNNKFSCGRTGGTPLYATAPPQVAMSRKLGMHTVYGDESAMDELDALVRNAMRYVDLKVHGKEVDGCVLAPAVSTPSADQAVTEDYERGFRDGYERRQLEVLGALV